MQLHISDKKGVDIQKDMIGIFFEDINYGADGGIYAEMIENRSFEFLDARGDMDAYKQTFDGLYGWKAYPDEKAVKLEILDLDPVNHVNPHYLHIEAKAQTGFTNKAYDGVLIESGKSYKISFWARTAKKQIISIGVVNDSFLELCRIKLDQNGWEKYETEVTANFGARKALFAIVFADDAIVDFDCISMFPSDAVCGVFRKDLTEKLEELNPGFIRFPGGCIVEGNELTNRYQWKKTIGPMEQRKANWNRWAVHENCAENHFTSKFNHYNQTLGLGYYEYFLLCEHLGAKALPVANVGLACQYQSTELVKRDDPAYQEYIQDVLDLIEFANGDITTEWGKVRAQMGHPDSFHLEMVGIGNEQWQTERVDFFERYDDFEKAIHEKYPEIKLIGSAGPTVFTPTYDAAWKNYYEKAPKIENYTYAVDEHYYMEPKWFLENTHFYDNYDRGVKVFSGEYAAHDPVEKRHGYRNNWRCALSEAAFLTGIERNADVVYLASYAPLFARIDYVQWAPDLIWFDDKDCYGTPSYYVQKLFRNNTGDYTLVSELPEGEENKVFQTVSYSEKEKAMYVKLINASEKDQIIELQLPVSMAAYKKMEVTTMHGEIMDVNSIEQPCKVAPRIENKSMETMINLQANSFIILKIS